MEIFTNEQLRWTTRGKVGESQCAWTWSVAGKSDYIQGCNQTSIQEETMLQSPSFPLELGPLNQVESLRKRRERPQQGLGRRPTDKSNLVYFSLKM